MSKIAIRYERTEEVEEIIRALEKEFEIKDISKPYKSGKYKRVYVSI